MALGARTSLDREINAIQEDILAMAKLVDHAIEQAMEALQVGDNAKAQQVILGDDQINRLRFTIEEACLTLIVTQQPAARDLRTVTSAIQLVTEIERIGDHAAGIAKTALLMEEEPLHWALKRLLRMAELSRQMLSDAMQAYLARDAEWARQIAARDSEMDELYKQVFSRLVKTMAKRPQAVKRATYMLWCAHNLERIADRVTNIAERVIYMVTGIMEELNV